MGFGSTMKYSDATVGAKQQSRVAEERQGCLGVLSGAERPGGQLGFYAPSSRAGNFGVSGRSPVSGAGHSGSAQCANRLCKGEATALRAVAVASLGVDAFGALQAANQSLKTFKDHGAVRFWTRQG